MDGADDPGPMPPGPRPTFTDPDLEAAFERDGYVVVPLLDASAVAALRADFLRLVPDAGFGSHYTSQSADVGYRRETLVVIAAAFQPALASLLDRFRPVVANFFAKEAQAGTSMVIHQDWAFVDETRSRSVNVWCPLEDASVANGTLHVLPGSHRMFDNLRGTATDASGLPSPFAGIEDYATRQYLQPVVVPAGCAIVNDHRLVHSSPDNRSGTLRVAASLTLVPAEDRVRHYYGRPGGTVDVYEIDDRVLCDHLIGAEPRGHVIDSIAYSRPPLSRTDLDALMAGAGRRGPSPSPARRPRFAALRRRRSGPV